MPDILGGSVRHPCLVIGFEDLISFLDIPIVNRVRFRGVLLTELRKLFHYQHAVLHTGIEELRRYSSAWSPGFLLEFIYFKNFAGKECVHG